MIDDFKMRILNGVFKVVGSFITTQMSGDKKKRREKYLNEYYKKASAITAKYAGQVETIKETPKIIEKPAPAVFEKDLTDEKIKEGTSCIPCVPPDSLIISNPGVKEIKELSIGDKVLDANGNYSKVTYIYNNKYKGPIYDIYVKYKNKPLTITPEHPMLVTRMKPCHRGKGYCTPNKKTGNCGLCERKYYKNYQPQWLKPSELFVTKWKSNYTQDKLFLMMPRIKKIVDKKVTFLRYYLPKEYIVEEKDGYLEKKVNGRTTTEMKSRIKINTYLLKLIGYYLAEGHSSKTTRSKTISFSFGKHEEEYANETKRLIEDCFRTNATIYEKETALAVVTTNKLLSFFMKQFGDNAHNKKIPEWILYLPPKKQKILLEGYFKGDGYINKGKYNNISCTTVSSNLAKGTLLILERLGITAHYRINEQKDTQINGRIIKSNGLRHVIDVWGESAVKLIKIVDKNKLKKWKFRESHATAIDENFIYYPLKKIDIRKYDGAVMNLETESHNYIAGGIIVSNCSRDHLSVASAVLKEATRFSVRDKGMKDPEVAKRINAALEELNALERIDLAPENISNLQGREKELAKWALNKSADLRHSITATKTPDELMEVSAQATDASREMMAQVLDMTTDDNMVDKLCGHLEGEAREECVNAVNPVLPGV